MTEGKEQKAIVKWFRQAYPKYAMSLRVSQSKGAKGNHKRAAMAWSQIVSQGGVKGEADIAILLPRGEYGSLLIEHKSDDAIRGATEDQLEYIRYHNSIGNCACVTKGIDMAMAAIEQYMSL